jgi:hypothetical protein
VRNIVELLPPTQQLSDPIVPPPPPRCQPSGTTSQAICAAIDAAAAAADSVSQLDSVLRKDVRPGQLMCRLTDGSKVGGISVIRFFFCSVSFYTSSQCFGSGPTWIRIQLVSWIRIRIRNADPDPGCLKRAKIKKKRS